MSNSNTSLQTQTSNALHNDIIEAGGKDRSTCIIASGIRSVENPESRDTSTPNQTMNLSTIVSKIHHYSTNWLRMSMTLVKQSQELKTISYHKLYDILKQHQNEVNEIRTERLEHTAMPLALVAQQKLVYHHQNHPTQTNQYSSNKSQQPTRNRGKEIVNSFAPIYDQEPVTVTEDDEMSKEKEIDKLMAQGIWASMTRVSSEKPKDVYGVATYHKEKMLLCKQEEVGVQLNAEQADWKDDTDVKSNNQKLEAHYMYMAQIQEVTPIS
ncbi:hypothetical protein Tco_1218889 [Tanacetum coccineum]